MTILVSPQSTPVEVTIAEAIDGRPRTGVIVDSHALYGVRLHEPWVAGQHTIRSVVALRRYPGLDAIVSHQGRLVVQLFLLQNELRSLEDFDWANLAFDLDAMGTIRLLDRASLAGKDTR